jgi:uncharacterized protein (TIGR01244 family)
MKQALFAIIVWLTCAAAVAADVQKKDLAGIRNYSRVDATIGCGGATPLAAMPALKAEGFASVINLRLADEPGADIAGSRQAAERAGLKYIHIPITARNPEPPQIEKFLQVVSDKANQPAFIHCGSANRVGGVWLIKRVRIDKWPVEKAVVEAEAIGLTNPELKEFAVAYAQKHAAH